MTEKDFDIEIRSILENAEEEVSSKVWKGVAAGLGKSRVIPWYAWGAAASVAVAAAVAAVVVLTRPVPEQQIAPVTAILTETPTQTSIFMSEATPGEEIPRERPRLSQAAKPATQSAAEPAVQPETTPETKAEAKPAEATKAPKSAKKPEAAPSAQSDNAAFNQLVFQQEKSAVSEKGFAFTAFGNVQGHNRSSSAGAYSRRYGVPALNSGVGIYNESSETSFGLPFSIGIGLKYKLSKNWAVSTGIRYSYMQRSFVGDYQGEGFRIVQTDIMNHQHWLGIPLNLSYEFVKKGRWNVYATAGGAAEWLLDNNFVVHNSPQDILYHNNRGKTQFSAMAGVGMEYRISPFVGLYLDPGFRYYFATWNQPRSIRTVQPLRFEIEAGLRFNLRR